MFESPRDGQLEGFAVWTAIGPENRDEYGNVGGSTPHPSATFPRCRMNARGATEFKASHHCGMEQ